MLQQHNSYDCGLFVLLAADVLSEWVERGEQDDLEQLLASRCTQQAVTQSRQQLAATVRSMAAEAQQLARSNSHTLHGRRS